MFRLSTVVYIHEFRDLTLLYSSVRKIKLASAYTFLSVSKYSFIFVIGISQAYAVLMMLLWKNLAILCQFSENKT